MNISFVESPQLQNYFELKRRQLVVVLYQVNLTLCVKEEKKQLSQY